MMNPHDEEVVHHSAPHHVTPLWQYFVVFGGLIFLTLLTVAASRVNMGVMNTPVALLIATAKSVLVILFFMHVIHSTRLTWVVILSAFLWLGVMFALTFTDYLTRAWTIYQ
jgi:cytochrome c oxidase subunit 4